MSRTPQRIPLSRWKQGQVLRLKEPVCGIREGWFAFVGLEGAKFTVCRLGQNESGNLCQTDETDDLHVDFAESFILAMGMGRVCSG